MALVGQHQHQHEARCLFEAKVGSSKPTAKSLQTKDSSRDCAVSTDGSLSGVPNTLQTDQQGALVNQSQPGNWKVA